MSLSSLDGYRHIDRIEIVMNWNKDLAVPKIRWHVKLSAPLSLYLNQ